eukprot:11374825-Heterocapsa_arctica.AAC.1
MKELDLKDNGYLMNSILQGKPPKYLTNIKETKNKTKYAFRAKVEHLLHLNKKIWDQKYWFSFWKESHKKQPDG